MRAGEQQHGQLLFGRERATSSRYVAGSSAMRSARRRVERGSRSTRSRRTPGTLASSSSSFTGAKVVQRVAERPSDQAGLDRNDRRHPGRRAIIDDGMDLIDDLEARGLIHDSTDLEFLRARGSTSGSGRRSTYGFDPTADCLHVGHLIGLDHVCAASRLAGHRPIAAGRRRDRHDRRPERHVRGAQPARRRRRSTTTWPRSSCSCSGSSTSSPSPYRGDARRQRDWTQPITRARVPPRRRQARHRQPDAGPGVRCKTRLDERARHLVHRVQLHAAAGQRLPVAPRAPRRARSRSAAPTSGATSSPAST